jgi:hypothetical protein
MKILTLAIALTLFLSFYLLSCGDDDDDSGGIDGGDDDTDNGGDDDNDDTGSDDDDLLDDDDNDTTDDDNHVSGDTWSDPSTGLTWQVHQLDEYLTRDAAVSYCENLAMAGGGWHLPTISELRTLIRGCEGTITGGACGVMDSCLDSSCEDVACSSCDEGDGPNGGCYGPLELPAKCDGFWSSSLVADSEGGAWAIYFGRGYIHDGYVGDPNGNVRCVR